MVKIRPPRLTVRRLIVLMGLVTVGTWWLVGYSERLPSGWDRKAFEDSVRRILLNRRPVAGVTVDVELLAWSTNEDDRPLLYDQALVWARINDGDRDRWAILMMYRHPSEDREWYLSIMTHSKFPVEYFDRAPRNAEVHEFIDQSIHPNFFAMNPDGFRTLDHRVRRWAWYRAIGELPTRSYR